MARISFDDWDPLVIVDLPSCELVIELPYTAGEPLTLLHNCLFLPSGTLDQSIQHGSLMYPQMMFWDPAGQQVEILDWLLTLILA